MKKPTTKKPQAARPYLENEARARANALTLRRTLRHEQDIRRLTTQHARAIGDNKRRLIAFILETIASILSRDKADEVQRVLES